MCNQRKLDKWTTPINKIVNDYYPAVAALLCYLFTTAHLLSL